MLTLEPTTWFSWAFTVSRAGRACAALDISAWRERGKLVVEGQPFRVVREGLMSGDFRLESASGLLAIASRPSILRRKFVVSFGGRTLTLQPRSAWTRAVVLREGDHEVGTVSPRGLWSRRATATLPDTLPLSIQTFLLWLTVLLWKRESDSGAGVM
jgi:hypothetical protein